MKRTYFLDKIHNANIREFERIINTIVTDLNYEEYPYTYFSIRTLHLNIFNKNLLSNNQ